VCLIAPSNKIDSIEISQIRVKLTDEQIEKSIMEDNCIGIDAPVASRAQSRLNYGYD
jgi:hypothetical protein